MGEKVEEMALKLIDEWGNPPYYKLLDFPQWKRFINLDTCSIAEFNGWMAGYARWLAEHKSMMVQMLAQNWNLSHAMAERQQFADEAWTALNRRFPHHDCLKFVNNNDQLIECFKQL